MTINAVALAAKAITRVNSLLQVLSGVMILLMNFIVLYGVIMRYGFNRPPIWTSEVATFMLMFITFIPLGFVLQNNLHIKVDFVVMHLSNKAQRRLDIFNAFLGSGFAAILLWQSCRLVSIAFRFKWVTMETATPEGYPLIIMPLGCAVLFLSYLFKGLSELCATGNWDKT